MGCHALLQGIFLTQGSNPRASLMSPALAGRLFTTSTTWEMLIQLYPTWYFNHLLCPLFFFHYKFFFFFFSFVPEPDLELIWQPYWPKTYNEAMWSISEWRSGERNRLRDGNVSFVAGAQGLAGLQNSVLFTEHENRALSSVALLTWG